MNDLKSIVIDPGVRYCYHLPSFRDASDLYAAIKLSQYFPDNAIREAINPRPIATIWTRLFGTPTVSKWVASRLDCIESDAKARISKLPVPVHDQIHCNAHNLIRFLGFVLTTNSNPRILIYETSGKAHNGRKLLHTYSAEVLQSTAWQRWLRT